jgi:RNA polymerase sigma factor (TIGR02999 family)
VRFASPLTTPGSSQHPPGAAGGGGAPSPGGAEREPEPQAPPAEPAFPSLIGELYGELRQRAERFMRDQPRDQTLQATALVHEACLKLCGRGEREGLDRPRLLALASAAMRSVLVDHARARGRIKRSPPGRRLPIDELQLAFEERAGDLVALDAALAKLGTFDPEMVAVVDLHFFAGLAFPQVARATGIPLRTLERRWAATRAWLLGELR